MKIPHPSPRSEFAHAVWHFVAISVTGICISSIFATVVARMGVPFRPENYLSLSIAVSTFVTVPIAALSAQNEFRLRLQSKALASLASTDPLTGLLNRRFFLIAAGDETTRMQRTGQQAAIILFDIDHFKRLNDRFGHGFGDRVLEELAVIAHDELRGPFDRLGRWGGEEFIVLLSNVTHEQALDVCERLRTRIEENVFAHNGRKVDITASFGTAQLGAADILDEVIRRADDALYEAKSGGRNCVRSAENAVRAA